MTYSWMGPDNNNFSTTVGGGEPFIFDINNVDPNNEGLYEITAMNTTTNCISTPQSVFVEIDPTPTAPTVQVDNNQICEEDELVFTTTVYSDPDVTYTWTYNGNNLLDTSSPELVISNVNPGNDGEYGVIVNVGSCNPVAAMETQTIEVVEAVDAFLIQNIYINDSPACFGETIQLSVAQDPEVEYTWYGPTTGIVSDDDGLPHILTIPNVTMADAGAYYVEASNNICTPTSSDTTMVDINEEIMMPMIDISEDDVCEGADVTLFFTNNIPTQPGDVVTYDWTFDDGTVLINIPTNDPLLNINNVTQDNEGIYNVMVQINDCTSQISDNIALTVSELIQEEANAGEDGFPCGESTYILSANTPVTSIGVWSTTPGGAVIADDSVSTTTVYNLQEGENVFVWSLSAGSCQNYATDTVVVYYTELVDIAEVPDGILNFCEGDATSVLLNATVPTSANGMWSTSSLGVTIENPTSPVTLATGLEKGTYEFTWTLSDGLCQAYSQDVMTVIVDALPNFSAELVNEDQSVCVENDIEIEAIMPPVGTGEWISLGEAVIAEPSEEVTSVFNLSMGANQFVWSLTYESCVGYSTDTLTVFVESLMPETINDELNSMMETTISFDLLENDNLTGIDDWFINIIEQPASGTLTLDSDGTGVYTPDNNFFGEDTFIYEVCNNACEDACDLATVIIQIDEPVNADCYVPNIVTPNNDGDNDVLHISCAPFEANDELMVFNRWGDKVYKATGYMNDWDARFEGDILPAGTYFYVYKKEDDTVIKGYISIIR